MTMHGHAKARDRATRQSGMTLNTYATEAAGDAACGISRRAAHGPKENVESVKFFSWPADEPDVG
jgi:hypothetical protein